MRRVGWLVLLVWGCGGGGESGPPPDTVILTITPQQEAYGSQQVEIRFGATVAQASFQCRLYLQGQPAGDWGACATPYVLDTTPLVEGQWVLEVRAVAGAPDPEPAQWVFVVDHTPPEVPQILEAKGGDGRIWLQWSVRPEDRVQRVRVYWKETDFSFPCTECGMTEAEGQEAIVGGLQNGVTYFVRLTAVDAAGNESAATEAVQVVPHIWRIQELGDQERPEITYGAGYLLVYVENGTIRRRALHPAGFPVGSAESVCAGERGIPVPVGADFLVLCRDAGNLRAVFQGETTDLDTGVNPPNFDGMAVPDGALVFWGKVNQLFVRKMASDGSWAPASLLFTVDTLIARVRAQWMGAWGVVAWMEVDRVRGLVVNAEGQLVAGPFTWASWEEPPLQVPMDVGTGGLVFLPWLSGGARVLWRPATGQSAEPFGAEQQIAGYATRTQVRTSGDLVVWEEPVAGEWDFFTYRVDTGQTKQWRMAGNQRFPVVARGESEWILVAEEEMGGEKNLVIRVEEG